MFVLPACLCVLCCADVRCVALLCCICLCFDGLRVYVLVCFVWRCLAVPCFPCLFDLRASVSVCLFVLCCWFVLFVLCVCLYRLLACLYDCSFWFALVWLVLVWLVFFCVVYLVALRACLFVCFVLFLRCGMFVGLVCSSACLCVSVVELFV